MSTRRALCAAIGVLAAVGTLASVDSAVDAAAAATASGQARVVDDCVHATRAPSDVIIRCSDDGVFFEQLRYDTWTDRRATGTGQLWTSVGGSTSGKYVHRVAHVTMDEPKRFGHQLRFSRIVARYVSSGGTQQTRTFHPPLH